MSIVGKKFPSLDVSAMNEMGDTIKVNVFEEAKNNGKKVLLFWYPKDFTFVCPTELHAFQAALGEFEKRGVAVVGCSVDSKFSHWAWLNTEKNDGGIKGVKYPLVSDLSKTIAENYGVLAGEYDFNDEGEATFIGAPVAFRGTFLIDKSGVIRHSVINDLPLGRSIDESLRMVDALQYFEKHGEVCPANWKEGEDAMTASTDGVAEYLASH